MPDRFITVQEAAEQLRIHPQTLRLWLRDGKLRGRVIGGRKSGYRIPATQIDRLLAPGDEAPAARPPGDAGQFRLGRGAGAEPR